MKTSRNWIASIIMILALFACQKNKDVVKNDIDTLRNHTNKKSYPAGQMDSAQAISAITKQKIQELLDLSTLYRSGKKDTDIDSFIYSQMESYFYKPDSTTFKALMHELDSLNVQKTKVKNVSVFQKMYQKDTLDFVNFDVEYYNPKMIGTFPHTAQFILVKAPVKFQNEFKFYFINFYQPLPKDSILSEVPR